MSNDPRSTRSAPPKRIYHCAVCERELKNNRWVYSQATGNRFCFPGECRKKRISKEATGATLDGRKPVASGGESR